MSKHVLERAGYQPGQCLSRNVARQMLGFGLLGMTVACVVGVRPRTVEDLVPLGVFVSMALFGLFVVARWHATRPNIVFEEEGLRIDGTLVEWDRIKRVDVGSWTLDVEVDDERGRTTSYKAVRAV